MAERKCSESTRAGRFAKADQFEHAAALVESYASDSDDLNDAYITMCVHAGIAAADVITCKSMGVHHQGENHNKAVALVRKVDKGAADDLATLLKMKTSAGYGADASSRTRRKQAKRAMGRLMDTARTNR